jgi:Family of unknown function (DUF6090)
MIKFFRKIRQNLLMENKTGKYLKYAIGEIILVIVGILIAVQINEWNENRISQLRIDSRLINLTKDLETEIKEMSGILKASKSRIIVNKAILIGSNRLGSFSVEDTIFQEYNSKNFINPNSIISHLRTLDGNRSTYNGLINSAEFYLIKDLSLANRIQNYYAKVDELKDAERWENQETWMMVNKSKHRLGLGTYSSEVTMEKLIQSAKDDRQFGAELEHQYVLDLGQYYRITYQKKEAIDLIKVIESRKK